MSLNSHIPQTKQEAEDRAIALFNTYMSKNGIPLSFVENPDRTPDAQKTIPGLNTDALFSHPTSSQTGFLSLDVMSLAENYQNYQIPTELAKKLNEIAKARKLSIRVLGTVIDIDQVNRTLSYVAILAQNGNRKWEGTFEGTLKISLRKRLFRKRASGDIVVFPGAGSSDLAEQIHETIKLPFSKKATTQSLPAKQMGAKSFVLLDWNTHAGIKQGTHWLPKYSYTVGIAVSKVLKSLPQHNLDCVLLLNKDLQIEVIWGNI